MAARTIRNSDSSYKVVTDTGATLGFIHCWDFRPNGAVNLTGERRFRAVPIGHEPMDAGTLSSAERYITAVMAAG